MSKSAADQVTTKFQKGAVVR